MRRLTLLTRRKLAAPALVVALALLALAGLAVASNDPERTERGKAQAPTEKPVEVIELSTADVTPATERSKKANGNRKTTRPAEKVSEDDLEAVENTIRSRSSDEAAPDDGVSPGAPTDEEVRDELRQLRREQRTGGSGPIARGAGGLVRPVDGQFTSPFGQRWGRLHAGIDLAAPTGTPIRAAAAGRVILMAPTGGYGNYTCIDHGSSVSTCYAHQSQFGTSEGALVEQGEVVGYVGNTGHSFGAHLHFEVRIDGRPTDPMNYF